MTYQNLHGKSSNGKKYMERIINFKLLVKLDT